MLKPIERVFAKILSFPKRIIGSKQKKRFIKWLYSYVLVALVMITFVMVGNVITSRFNERELSVINSRIIAQTQVFLDEYLSDAETFSHRILNSLPVHRIYSPTLHIEIDLVENIQTIQHSLTLGNSSNKIIEESLLIFREQDICISSNLLLNRRLLFLSIFEEYFDTEEKFNEFIDEIFRVNVRDIKVLTDRNGNQRMILVSTFISDDVLRRNPVAMIVFINPSVVVEKICPPNSGNIIITALENRNIIFNQNDVYIPLDDINYYELMQNISVNGRAYILNHTESTMFPIRYICVCQVKSTAKVHEKVQHLRQHRK